MSTNQAILTVVILTLMGVGGDWLLKQAGIGSIMNKPLFIGGFLLYATPAIGWYVTMKYIELSHLGAIYGVVTFSALALIGILYYGEKITWMDTLGLTFALFSILLLSRHGN